jgi:hypothetical protein
MTIDDPSIGRSRPLTRIGRLARDLRDEEFRNGYMARQVKAFLATQIRSLRGEQTQSEFGEEIGKPQSVVSRLESQVARGMVNIQTLIDIAQAKQIAVIIRFVNFETFLKFTNDYTERALVPHSYSQEAIDILAREEEDRLVSPLPLAMVNLMNVSIGTMSLSTLQLASKANEKVRQQQAPDLQSSFPTNLNGIVVQKPTAISL